MVKGIPFTGLATALVTPFTEDGIDYKALEKLMERQRRAGVDALVALGTTGEPSVMSEEERDRVTAFCCEWAEGKMPLIVGTGGNCTKDVAARSARAEKLGAKALLVVTPYYNKATEEGLIAHFQAVAGAVSLPVIAYNVPSRTGVNLSPEAAERLSGIKNIVGLKEAAADPAQWSETALRLEGKMALYGGNDDGYLYLSALGARGLISVASNVAPRMVKKLTEACRRGDFEAARAAHFALLTLNRLLFSEVSPAPAKAALFLLGLIEDRLRLPLTRMTEAGREKLKCEMTRLGILPEAANYGG